MLSSRRRHEVLLLCAIVIAALIGSASGGFAAAQEPARGAASSEAALNDDAAAPADVQTRDSCWIWVEVKPGEHQYVNICETPGGGDDDDDSGEVVKPTCDLSAEPYNEFCKGVYACHADIPSPIPHDEWPEESRPSDDPDLIYTYYYCRGPGGDDDTFDDTDWLIPYPDSLPEWGWAAWGTLQTPAFTLSFDPAGMTYVGADTEFAVDGIGDGEIEGEMAGPLQAIGTLRHIEIDPGDSSGTIECDNDAETSECVHVYLETSLDQSAVDLDDRPAYPAQARLVYDVTYLMNGRPINVWGIPDRLESPWNGTRVPVGEIQVLVR